MGFNVVIPFVLKETPLMRHVLLYISCPDCRCYPAIITVYLYMTKKIRKYSIN